MKKALLKSVPLICLVWAMGCTDVISVEHRGGLVCQLENPPRAGADACSIISPNHEIFGALVFDGPGSFHVWDADLLTITNRGVGSEVWRVEETLQNGVYDAGDTAPLHMECDGIRCSSLELRFRVGEPDSPESPNFSFRLSVTPREQLE